MGLVSATDQMGERVDFNFPPRRIISLVPSQSELLWDLGLENEIAGITKFCVHPGEMFRGKMRVGGTKKIDLKKIEALKPDLIIGNKEENERSDIELLKQKFPVWMSEIYTLSDALHMIRELSKFTDRGARGEMISDKITRLRSRFQEKRLKKKAAGLKVAYFIWKDPYMVAGRDNFIDHMLGLCGLKNVFSQEKFSPGDFGNKNFRYPEISAEQLKLESPDHILLSSEPYPFKEKHFEEFKKICPEAKIRIVDGEMFSWYGTRLLKAFDYFETLELRAGE